MQFIIARHPSRPRRTPDLPHPTVPRAGFTLVELLTVVVILSILMAFLLPAIQNARTSARVAQVTADLSKLEDGISSFKAEFGGMEPPSSIVLAAPGNSWQPESRATLRRMWPQFNFANSGGATWTSDLTLNGSECLVFFLGGIRDSSGALRGFSKNPAEPFSTTGNRVGPFFEFDYARLSDVNENGFSEYRDPIPGQTTPYLYLSSYEGRGYRAADGGGFIPYQQTSVPATCRPNWEKAQSFQVISPGFDGVLGPGGALREGDLNGDGILNDADEDADNVDYNCDGSISGTVAEVDANGNGVLDTTPEMMLTGPRQAEADNITNFSNGMLAP